MDDAAKPRWRHKKRGTFYREIGRGTLQASDTPLDEAPVVIYRAEEDGALWARPSAEFEDGRFEAVEPLPEPVAGEPPAAIAEHIERATEALIRLADGGGLEVLAYFLAMAKLEATTARKAASLS